MSTVVDVGRDAAELKDDTIALRREFHQYPELGFEETRTADLVAHRLKDLGLPVEQGIGVTGVLAMLEGSRPGKTLMIRADMDGLPMAETPGRPYGSKIENRNHACGHDMNMALTISTAQVLARHRQELAGRVAFVFQPADELQTGAQRMMADGLWEKVKPDMVLSHHPLPPAKAGQVIVPAGAVWSSIDNLKLTIQGKGGWFGYRHDTVDCALIAAQVINALYAVAHAESSLSQPVMFTVGAIEGSGRASAVLGKVELALGLGVYDKALRQHLLRRIEEVAGSTVAAMRGSFSLEVGHALPPAINDPAVSAAVIRAAGQVVGEQNIVRDFKNDFPDDIAVFMDQVPGCMFMLGTQNVDKGIVHNWHNPGFDIDEETLPIGVEIMARAALDLLR